MTDITAIINDIIEREGGFVNDPDDRGGPTKYGITLATYAAWAGVPIENVTADDIRDIQHDTAFAIYHDMYVTQPGWERLEDEWTFIYIVDSGVHHGPKNATKLLQKAARPLLKIDGIFGPNTSMVVNRISQEEVIHDAWVAKLRRERSLLMGRIVRNDPTQAKYIVGWLKRAQDV